MKTVLKKLQSNPTKTVYKTEAETRIQFAVGTCTLGQILVAATEKGICAIFLGPDADALVSDLQERFTRADLSLGDENLQDWLAVAISAVEHPERKTDLPIDLIGTAFQVRVWEALREIPPGSTLTYQEIAERIGQPTSARAVGNACGSNPVAVLVPCHRVVRTDSSLGGYRWGIEIKTELLKREQIKE